MKNTNNNSRAITVLNRKKKKNSRTTTTTAANAFSSTFNPKLPISNRVHTCLKYKDSFTQSMTPGLGANYQFRMNSLYDPDVTGTGHQPYKYDQFTPGIFTRYRVYSCAWKVTFFAAGSAYLCTVCPTNGNLAVAVTNGATFNAVGELPFSESKGFGTGGTPNSVFVGKIDLNELGGYTPAEYLADDRFQAQYNADPTEVFLLNCCYYWPAVLGTVDVHFMVELCYDCELLDPPISAQS